jgi:hypothetical protein
MLETGEIPAFIIDSVVVHRILGHLDNWKKTSTPNLRVPAVAPGSIAPIACSLSSSTLLRGHRPRPALGLLEKKFGSLSETGRLDSHRFPQADDS